VEFQIDEKVVYVATGNRELVSDRKTVVLIHGAGQDHTIWVLPTRYFAHHQRNVLAVDLPGHGRSTGPALRTVEEMAEWIMRVLDTARLKTAAVVGHSLGSLIALEAAARYPHRVRALAMVGASVPMPVSEKLLATAEADDHDALDMLTLWGHSRSAHLGGNSTPGMWMLGCAVRLLERSASGVLHADLEACHRFQKGLERARNVSSPTLLVLGRHDSMTPVRAAGDLSRALANVETVVLEGSGHAILSERPDEVLDALIRIV
jgi:pimeloyl-ACP methyl ester carboxylesterase